MKDGRRDLVQCLPAYVEIRLNLWSIRGNAIPDGLTDNNQFVRVVISDFTYEESTVTHANPGDYCSKHCQCNGDCINGRCEDISTPSPSPVPSPVPNPVPSPLPSPVPSPIPSLVPSPSPSCPDSPLRFVWKENKRSCKWVGFKAFRCQKPKMSSHCPDTCGSCDVYGMQNSRATFMWGGVERDCAWFRGLKKWKKRKLCVEKDGIAYTCRRTCAPFRA